MVGKLIPESTGKRCRKGYPLYDLFVRKKSRTAKKALRFMVRVTVLKTTRHKNLFKIQALGPGTKA